MKLIKATIPNAVVFHSEDCEQAEEGALRTEPADLSADELRVAVEDEDIATTHDCVSL